MVNIYFSLPVLSVTKIVAWEFQVDDSTAGRYTRIISRDLLPKLGIDLKVSTNTIECGKGPYQGCTTLMENLYD